MTTDARSIGTTPKVLPIDDTTIRAIAEAAAASERSVQRRLLGLPVRGRVGQRIDRAIAAAVRRPDDTREAA